jgi:hypothetical protein
MNGQDTYKVPTSIHQNELCVGYHSTAPLASQGYRTQFEDTGPSAVLWTECSALDSVQSTGQAS